MKFNSIKFKVGNLFTIILGVILILYSAFLQFSLSRYLINDLDEELLAKVNEIGAVIEKEIIDFPGDDVDSVIQRVFSFPYPSRSDVRAVKKKKLGGESLSDEEKWFVKFDRLDLSQDMVAFWDFDGREIFLSQNISRDMMKEFIPTVDARVKDEIAVDVVMQKKYFRQIRSVIALPSGRQLFVVIATSKKPIRDLLQHRQHLLAVSIPVILLLTAFLGRLLAERILRPVNTIVSAARQISSRDLSKRLSEKDADEEMMILIDSFNGMIARLEHSFKHIEQFSSHVAHELKTPLAILRGETEVALRIEKTVSEYKEVLRGNMEEIEKIIRVIEDLLLLAKLDYDLKFLRFQEFNFNEFFCAIFEKTKLLAAEKNVDVRCSLPKENVFLKGDELHLRRLFFNIIHNAIKFTPPGKKVQLAVFAEGTSVKTVITDEGSGISAEYLPRIFDAFFQVPRKEGDYQKGSGLGLSIARSVAKAHHGSIKVVSQLKAGSVFTVILPLA